MRRGRPVLALFFGLLWGLGAVVLANMYGLTTLNPPVLYGVTGGAALLSLLWSRRRGSRSRNTAAFIAIALLTPTALWAQTGGCDIHVDPGDTFLSHTSPSDPLTIDPDHGDTIVVVLETHEPVDGGHAEIWLEVGGVKVPLRSGSIAGNSFRREFHPDELITPFGVLPGLHHVGGSIEDICEVDGYVRVLGNPLTNPVGIAAAAAVAIGLAGTLLSGLAPKPQPAAPPEPTPPPEPPPEVTPPPDATPREVEPADEEGPSEEGQPVSPLETRWLQARIFGDGPQSAPLGHFRPDTAHDIEVRIGPDELGWLTGTSPFPDEQLPGDGPHRLTVMLSEPNLLRTPQAARIMLPERGASTSAWFELATKPDTARVNARLIVLYGNRVLHTARLPHRVGATAGDDRLTVDNAAAVETVVQGMGGLGTTRPFDAAFIVNHDHEGAGRITGISDGTGQEVDLTETDIARTVALVTDLLGRIVDQPADYDAVDAAGTVDLLRALARHGSMLRERLVESLDDAIAGAARLQVVSAHDDAYFPFEIAYDFESPGRGPVEMCPTGRQLLTDGELGATCPGPHTSIVCPMGFWGLSKMIERRTHQKQERLDSRFFVSARPTPERGRIALSAGSVFAASDRVDAIAPGSIGRVAAAMAAASAGHSLRADSWKQWQDDVKTRHPSLLILLAHTVFDVDDAVHGLEIGDHDRMFADDIKRNELIPPEQQPAIVALLGCDTATTGEISFERFPGRFIGAGAEVVLGTITKVLGRHAAPIAERLVSALHDEVTGGAASIGDVMVKMRRRLLAEGIPAVLAVTAFGDADWIIEA